MKTIHTGSTRIYCLSGGQSLNQYLDANKGKRLRQSDRTDVDVIQEFEFRQLSQKVKVTADGQHVGAVGCYPPCFKVWDVNELTIKFTRGVDYTVRDFIFVDSDYRKVVLLGDERQLEFHSSKGLFFSTRVPRPCNVLSYNSADAHLYVAGVSNEIYRLDLEEGIWLPPLQSSISNITSLLFSPTLPLLFVAGEGVNVEVWDLRNLKKPLSNLVAWDEDIDEPADGAFREGLTSGIGVTAMDISSNGLLLAVGLSSGRVAVYDVRSQKPILSRDFNNSLPIVDLKVVKKSLDPDVEVLGDAAIANTTILCCDSKCMKILSISNEKKKRGSNSISKGELLGTVDVPYPIHNLEIYPLSGLVFMSCETPRLQIYYIPILGIAPKFSAYLENLTGEVDDTQDVSLFDSYKFVTRGQLLSMNAEHYIGTDLLKPHLHGYFMDVGIWNTLLAASKPALVQSVLDEEAIAKKKKTVESMRPVFKKKKTMVNNDIAIAISSDILNADTDTKQTALLEQEKKAEEKRRLMKGLLSDKRFQGIFEDEDFERKEGGKESNE